MRYLALIPLILLTACAAATYDRIEPYSLSKAQISTIQEAVAYNLFDPESARFRNIRAGKFIKEGKAPVVRFCGEVNAKNQYGGYTGGRLFAGVIENDVPRVVQPEADFGLGLTACSEF